MNKTVTINISGIIFHIAEDAFDNLSRYLSDIKAYLSGTEGGAEVLSDIEARIAELLQEKISPSKQVITLIDVEQVRDVMGQPEDFGGSESAGPEGAAQQERIRRRLFRNPDEKMIGGVCSGLAAYFDIDIVWVRLAMFLLVFFGGLSIWVYVILWIVIPEAKTTADKLAMRGENANLNNIYKNFKDEAQDVKNRFAKYGSELNRNYGERVRSNLSSALYTVFGVIGRLVGLFFILFGAALLIGYVATLTGISIVDKNHAYSSWKHAIFTSPSDYTLAVVAFILVVGVPVFVLLYLGIKLLFRIRYSNRWLSLGLGLIWLCGVVLGIFVTVQTAEEFSDSSRVREASVLHGSTDTIVVKMRPASQIVKGWDLDMNDDIEDALDESSGYEFGRKGKKLVIMGHAELDVIESNSDSVELVVNFVSKGSDKDDANKNARAIRYNYEIKGNEVIFDELFRVADDNKFRVQEVDIKIRLPKGKVIYFDESVKHLLDDVDNTTNTPDAHMVNRRWIMSSRGLKCIDCDNLEEGEDFEGDARRKHDHVIINGDGISVDDHGSRIRINKKGIMVHTPEEDVEMKRNRHGKPLPPPPPPAPGDEEED
jgi:phage shock protein PspC (stress-responsive transcriptional regulator)